MDRAAAVASRVVLLRGVLSDAEILQLDALYARIRAEEAEPLPVFNRRKLMC